MRRLLFLLFFFPVAAMAAPCGQMAHNPITGEQDCVGSGGGGGSSTGTASLPLPPGDTNYIQNREHSGTAQTSPTLAYIDSATIQGHNDGSIIFDNALNVFGGFYVDRPDLGSLNRASFGFQPLLGYFTYNTYDPSITSSSFQFYDSANKERAEWDFPLSGNTNYGIFLSSVSGAAVRQRQTINISNGKQIFSDIQGNPMVEFDPTHNSSFTIASFLSTATISGLLKDSSLSAGTSGWFLMSRGSGVGPQWNPSSGGGGGSFINNQNSLQSGATFYVSSGTVLGQFSAVASAANIVPLIVKQAPNQTADFQEWLSSTNVVISSMDAIGVFQTGVNVSGSVAFGPESDATTRSGIWFGKVPHSSGYANIDSDGFSIDFNTPGNYLFEHQGTILMQTDPFGVYIENGVFGILGSGFAVLSHTQNPGAGNAQTNLSSLYSTAIPLVVQGAASQSADLLELQNSVGVILSSMDSTGNLSVPQFYTSTLTVTKQLTDSSLSPGTSGYFLMSRGAGLGPQWNPTSLTGAILNQNTLQTGATFYVSSGAVNGQLNIVNSNGSTGPSGVTLSDDNFDLLIGNNLASSKFRLLPFSVDMYFDNTANGSIVFRTNQLINPLTLLTLSHAGAQTALVSIPTSDQIGEVIRGAASQSANLQEWQNSSGVVLSSVSSSGELTVPKVSASTGVFSGLITAPFGSAALPGISWAGDTGTGIYHAGTNQVGFSANGAFKFLVQNAETDVRTNFLPYDDNSYDLGSSGFRWKNVYFAGTINGNGSGLTSLPSVGVFNGASFVGLTSGTSFQAFVPTAAITLKNISFTVDVASAGGSGDTWTCTDASGHSIAVVSANAASAGTLTTVTGSANISAGTTVYMRLDSAAVTKPQGNISCGYVTQ